MIYLRMGLTKDQVSFELETGALELSLKLYYSLFSVIMHHVFGFQLEQAQEDEKPPFSQSLLAAIHSGFQLQLPGHFLPGFHLLLWAHSCPFS